MCGMSSIRDRMFLALATSTKTRLNLLLTLPTSRQLAADSTPTENPSSQPWQWPPLQVLLLGLLWSLGKKIEWLLVYLEIPFHLSRKMELTMYGNVALKNFLRYCYTLL